MSAFLRTLARGLGLRRTRRARSHTRGYAKGGPTRRVVSAPKGEYVLLLEPAAPPARPSVQVLTRGTCACTTRRLGRLPVARRRDGAPLASGRRVCTACTRERA